MTKSITPKEVFILIIITIFALFPILVSPNLVLHRSNDLQEQFWPVFYFIRENFFKHGQLALWSNLFFSGLPILPDPQFSLFYPPNILFIVLPTDTTFISHIFVHTFLAALGMYLLCKKSFNLPTKISLFASCLYILNPKFISYLEAGHYTLIASYSWLPFLFWSVLNLTKKPNFRWLVLFSLSLAGLFYTHTLIFTGALILTTVIVPILLTHFKSWGLTTILFFSTGIFLLFGLIAISLLPQIEWLPVTTRHLLLQSPDTYPKWTSKVELIKSVFISSSETEKILTLGLLSSFLIFFGFLKIRNNYKLIIGFISLITLLIFLNNASPIYQFLIKQNWFLLSRVSTRTWPLFLVGLIPLAGIGLDKLLKTNKHFFTLFAFLTLAELLFWEFTIFNKPINTQVFAPQEVYAFLASDKDRFRVYCVTRCLSQHQAALYHLELIEGYNTLQQENYYKESWQMMGGYWNYYTLALPPFGSYLYDKIQPDAKSLGEYNAKYILSSYQLTDKNFEFIKTLDNLYIYTNKLYLPRATVPITTFTPNLIRLDTQNTNADSVILREVYSPGWHAFLNGKEEVAVQQTPIGERLVKIKPDTQFVDFVYAPQTFKIGALVTLATLVFILITYSFLITPLFSKIRSTTAKTKD